MKIPLRNSAMLTFLAAALAGNVHAQFGATAASQTPEAREAAARATAAKIQQASAQPAPRTPDGFPTLQAIGLRRMGETRGYSVLSGVST